MCARLHGKPACLALPPVTGTVSGSEDASPQCLLWVCGCHMGRGGVTDLAMALPLNLCIMQRLPGDSWHLCCQGLRQCVAPGTQLALLGKDW